jgi:3-hydroxyisobutyrate dehydrogenase-like beta-hydroxyacid dehydrogenase
MKIGFIGLGQMGAGMASSLLRAGHELTVYNRTPQKTRPLAALGATVADRVAEACKGDVVFTMLADDHALEDVALGSEGILQHLIGEAIHVSCSTISVALAHRLTALHASAGQALVSSPVFGRPEAAASGKLFVLAAGPKGPLERVKPLLESMGQKVAVLSERPEDANLLKLSGNFLIASMIEALGETLALVRKGGLDPRQCLDFLTSTVFDVPIYRNYGGMIVERRFTPAGFAAPLGQKDIRFVLAAADSLGVPMPLAGLLRDRFLRLMAQGGEELDWTAIGNLAAVDAGTVRTGA